MIQRYWDPGIREEERLTGRFESEIRFGDGILQGRKAEDGNSRFSFDFGWVGLIEVTMKMEIWIWRKLRITRIGILILISIIIKTKLNQEENVHGMQEDHVDLEDEDVMDMDEIKAHLLENDIDMDAKDFLEKLEEEETKEVGKKQKEENNAQETDEVVFVEEEQGTLGGDAVKKPGLRKSLFKPSTGTAGSTKMRAFNALASPRKRAAERPGTRHGDTTNQAESKGASNPKLGNQRI
ncbi:hypothetical protein YC2023_052332 [Brassica napus]